MYDSAQFSQAIETVSSHVQQLSQAVESLQTNVASAASAMEGDAIATSASGELQGHITQIQSAVASFSQLLQQMDAESGVATQVGTW